MKFLLEIELGNDAMKTMADVETAIGESMARFVTSPDLPEVGTKRIIFDMNGNTVGKWQVSE